MIYLDNAATTSPKPIQVVRAVDMAVKKLSANPGRSGHSTSAAASDEIYATRKTVAELFGCSSPERVVFTLNCTHALNYVIKGILKKGDHVIVSSVEHNAVMRPIYKMFKDGLITYDEAQAVFLDDEATVKNFRSLIRNNTKMIICTAASNVTGQMLPIGSIGKLCREYGILFTVDAAQAAGVVDININELCIDYLCCAGHKGLYGPMGTGILVAAKEISNTLIEGGTGNLSAIFAQPDELPERLESGTVNLPGIIGLKKGIEFVKGRGINSIYRHELRLIQRAYSGLSRDRLVKLYTPVPKAGQFVPVMVFNVGVLESSKTGKLLNSMGVAVRTGLHCAPSAHRSIGTLDYGAVRISTSAFSRSEEIERFLSIVHTIARKY